MAAAAQLLARTALRPLAAADALCNRLYGWRFNPLYQSGTIVVTLYLVLVATGLWLLLFYRIGSPYESVAWVTANPWIGNWVRGLHRYASDLAVVATLVHAYRMFAQGRSWGPHTLAWVSGVLLLGLILVCGWTGYVLVWDTFGALLAQEGARLADALPVLSEPTSRAFTGESPVPTAFFFLTLFAHVALPLGAGVLFWLHIRRVARPALLPPQPLLWSVVGGLSAMAIVAPLGMAPEASPFTLPETVPVDLFFAFWLPLSRRLSPGMALTTGLAVFAALAAVPFLTRRRQDEVPPSVVDEELCTGCEQCAQDCPYTAITMTTRADGRQELLAQVDPSLCVSCGICAGSCAPMGIGPPGRTGRDQLARVRAFRAGPDWRPGAIVVISCTYGAARFDPDIAARGGLPFPVRCVGNLHTSVIELLVRGGAGGVLVAGCPPRDCRHREGARWLTERVHHEREAELQARVDRRRVRLVWVTAADRPGLRAAFDDFAAAIAALPPPTAAPSIETDTECEAAGATR